VQIAGSRCFVCGHNIGVMREGAACLTCEIVVHKNCSDGRACPKSVVAAVASAVMGSAFLHGLAWSRKFYLLGSPLLFGAELVLGNRGAQPGFNWWRFGVELGSYLVWAFFLTRPKAAAFFNRSQRQTVAA
jgi:hypothetical protein